MHDRQKLKLLEERVARMVANVNGYLSQSETDDLCRLRVELGEKWDAINNQWEVIEQGYWD